MLTQASLTSGLCGSGPGPAGEARRGWGWWGWWWWGWAAEECRPGRAGHRHALANPNDDMAPAPRSLKAATDDIGDTAAKPKNGYDANGDDVRAPGRASIRELGLGLWKAVAPADEVDSDDSSSALGAPSSSGREVSSSAGAAARGFKTSALCDVISSDRDVRKSARACSEDSCVCRGEEWWWGELPAGSGKPEGWWAADARADRW